MPTLTFTAVTTGSASVINTEIEVSGATWKSPANFKHLYQTSCIAMMLDLDNNILYLHDESGNHLIQFDNTQAATTEVTGQGTASDVADLYSKIKNATA